MTLDPRRLRGVAAELESSRSWELSAAEWQELGIVVDRLAAAVARDDAGGVEAAHDDLVRLDPRRRIVRARFEPTPMPDDLRERQNTIVREIVVRAPGRTRGRTAPDGDAPPGG